MDKLKEKFKEIGITDGYWFNDATACAELTREIAVKFAIWLKDESWKLEYAEQQSFTTSELFTFFLEQELKPQE